MSSENYINNPLFIRSLPVLGEEGVKKIACAWAAVIGLGGVGGSAFEALARCGIGNLTIIDGDIFEESNLNRQSGAMYSTLGKNKSDVFKNKLSDINPDCECHAYGEFVNKDNICDFGLENCDIILDAVDDVKAKIAIAVFCRDRGIRLISCMGTGNRIHPERLMISDIFKTSGCPLARSVRRELKKAGVESLDVVWSDEVPVSVNASNGFTVGSVSFVPPVAGYIMASYAVNKLLEG